MSRTLMLLVPVLFPFVLTGCETDEIPSWFLELPCPDGEYTLSNLETETQTCTVLPESCSMEQFLVDGPTPACTDDLCPDELPTGVIVASEAGEVSVDCGTAP